MKKILIILFVMIINVVLADTINIPADYSTIQEGIDNAVNGDTVLVQPGTYIENINYNGKNITLASLYFTTQDTSYISQTIIDGDSLDSVVKFENGEDSTAVLSGFTITNGNADFGGGVLIFSYSSPTLCKLIVVGNIVTCGGGGIYCYDNSNSIFNDVRIFKNSAGYGGGICIGYYSSPILENIIIKSNISDDAGGGIYCRDSNPNLTKVIIRNNISTENGGGIYCYSSPINLENVSITNNNANSSGGGIYCSDSSPNIVNTIVAENYGNYGIYNNITYPGNPVITYSAFYNNEVGNFYEVNDSIGINVITNVNGDSCDVFYNIQLDPLFVDPENGDYHLSWVNYPIPDDTKSPCIDAGDPNSPLDPDGTVADMGAYYFNQGVSIDNPQTNEDTLLRNYPNPIYKNNNYINIDFKMKKNGKVHIVLYNIKGQRINSIVNEEKGVGNYSISKNISNLSSGIYFIKMDIDGKTEDINKIVILK